VGSEYFEMVYELNMKKLTIALTGGIGSGKSSVATLFKELTINVIDADAIARDIVKQKTNSLQQIINHFGKEFLLNDGNLDRVRLRQLIFDEPNEKQWLENLLHPLIRQEIQKKCSNVKSAYCIVVIPLLFETAKDENHEDIDRILVVDANEELQIKRVMDRDRCQRETVLKIMATQVPRQKRLHLAHYVILNEGNLIHLKNQVLKFHDKFLEIATQLSQHELS